MGILSELGPVMPFEKANESQPQLKSIAVRQFLNVLKKYRNYQKPSQTKSIKWGEEIEGHFLQYEQDGSLKLSKENITPQYQNLDFPLMAEFGSFMFETTPAGPYDTDCNLEDTIVSIRDRYMTLQRKSKIALTIPNVPFLGVRHPTEEPFKNQITESLYISDDHVSSNPRFPTMTKSIRKRRGESLDIRVPLMMDQNTQLEEIRNSGEMYDGHIHMDATCFGLGMSCLQVTTSTKSLDHARYVYDQLNVLSPLFLAITAGTPFHKGKVSDWDARWNIISGSNDDRTKEERDPTHPNYIANSRYSSTNWYIGKEAENVMQYNDYEMGISQEEMKRVTETAESMGIEIDDLLSTHLANIMKRDIIIVHENFPQISEQENLLFEMLNGTNWNSVRLKIPTDDQIGWRVEFRTMEIQLTPDENAAYSLLIHLFTKVLHETTDLNLYIPISQLRENFHRAHQNNALMTQKFFCRTNVLEKGPAVVEEFTIHEILFGNSSFKGYYHFFMERLPESVKSDSKTQGIIAGIEDFLKKTTSGERKTLAQWMRNFVNNDHRYLKNSILPKAVMDDMLIELHHISIGIKNDDNFKPLFNLWDLAQEEAVTLPQVAEETVVGDLEVQTSEYQPIVDLIL